MKNIDYNYFNFWEYYWLFGTTVKAPHEYIILGNVDIGANIEEMFFKNNFIF